MKIEHTAINVPNATETVKWYCEHLGMKIVREVGGRDQVFFIADDSGQALIEFYTNPDAPVPDYAAMHPVIFHFAFVAEDIEAERERLIAAGATADGEINNLPNGDQLAFLRDPWGVTIQLAKRTHSMLKG
ncbi:MAG: VOC family protein [Chloroflexi bacterium]|nr:MAG: VOC family protein [Chloroflexota bacterium]